MRRVMGLVTASVLVAACRGPAPRPDAPLAGFHASQKSPQEPAPAPAPGEPDEPIDYAHMLDTGVMLRAPDGGWGAHLFFPIAIGWTEFDLSNISLDQLATLAVVPTAEFIIPLEERWVLLPSVGLGGAWQIGDNALIGSNHAIGLATASLQTMWWQPFADRYTVVLKTGVQYNAALTGRDGLLGDWGNVDLAAELRGAFGEPGDEPRFEPGIYAQTFYYWDPVELDITGVSPTSIDDQHEFGLSIGSTSRFEILGITLPRMFVGFRFGDDLSGVQIRFGRL